MIKYLRYLPGLSAEPPATETDWHSTEPWVQFGTRTVMFLCGGLLLASVLFDITGAVVASGQVAVEGEYKAVQHLEGGIVDKILVSNGDVVQQGQILVRLNDIQSEAVLTSISAKVADFSIQEARLIAERDLKETFEPPKSVRLSDGNNLAILDVQRSLFQSNRTAYLGQRKVLAQRLGQTDSQITGTTAQLEARGKERDLNERELSTVRPLFDKGYASIQRLGPLERDSVRIAGDIANIKSEINKLKAERSETEQRIAQADKEYSQRAAEELQKVQAQLGEQREAQKTGSDRLARTEVRAPIAGIVHALSVHTQGGVIQPGGTICQIIPQSRNLLVEAKIQPHDINSVRDGQEATVRFSSFDTHTTPRLKGFVRNVSAAEITDNQGKTYFTAVVEIRAEELSKLARDQRLIPGMPAEVFLETHERSIFSYFVKPLNDMMVRSFRER